MVTTVVVTRDDGLEVTATVHDGRYAAWWPGPEQAATVTAYRADGTVGSPVVVDH